MIKKLKNHAILGAISLLSVTHAAPGGFQDTMQRLNPLTTYAGPIMSFFLNAVSIGCAVYNVVKLVMHGIKSYQASNPNEAKQEKDAAVKSAVAAGISFVAVIAINIILAVFGISIQFAV